MPQTLSRGDVHAMNDMFGIDAHISPLQGLGIIGVPHCPRPLAWAKELRPVGAFELGQNAPYAKGSRTCFIVCEC